MKKEYVLITGGAGFIGSNFIEYFIKKYQNYNIINLDLLTYAGNLDNLKDISKNKRYKFIKGDICNKDLVEFIFKEYGIKGVIHFAAETHVDNSIKLPNIFIKTNINGTHNLLEVAKNNWLKSPFKIKEGYENARFHHISTDEVYGSLGEKGYFTESSPYLPNSPYSASKAGSNMLVRAYNKTFGLNTIITNCSNNYGPKQHNEKLIPTIIRNAIFNKEIPIYGDGLNIRDWLYVEEHCKGIDLAYHNGKIGETYNIGGNCEKRNIDIAKMICNILDKRLPKKTSYKEQISFIEDRFGHDKRYALNSHKIKQNLGFKVVNNLESNLNKTITFFIDKYMGGGEGKI
ncbi:dTDP-glucose 4,6-dehydratase [Helicobacter sp. MIT 14-3879]|uniref:dTDP-glucose 4,6-dehydratase n=1 Tax=Helicobacter sp. MIT 14-3879 TaxID=2040649 RepID=UPI000E1E63A6|nr:dTDP-glucose 4,6-dehydratase [Helicobacter sp. MIT 14-3879]RDU64780.1 dTDP-glucose 4,6-dehydratase [Helicobacter sp. MIT 14-3879]